MTVNYRPCFKLQISQLNGVKAPIVTLGKEFSKEIELNYSRMRLELLDKRVRLLDKFFYDIINIKNVNPVKAVTRVCI
jgi:hypothetical protein